MKRAVSNVGKAAKFGTPDEEVARIMKNKQNYYICLKVRSMSNSALKMRTSSLSVSFTDIY
jgi:hypothetical protein